MKRVIVSIFFLFLLSCNKICVKSIENEDYTNFLFENIKVKNEIHKIFELDKAQPKMLKVYFTRMNNCVRVTIYEVFSKKEIFDNPSYYDIYENNILLYYNGEEIILNKKLSNDDLDKLMARISLTFPDNEGMIYDSRVFQFDVSFTKKIKINYPAIEETLISNDHNVKFPSPNVLNR